MKDKTERNPISPDAELRSFVARFDAKQQKAFRAIRAAVRKRFPTANELAYEYPDSVVIGYTPTNRGIDAIVAVSLRADGVFLYLSHRPQLPDPRKRLQGSGKQTRFLRVDAPSELRHPDVEALIVAAVKHATVPLSSAGKGQLIIQSSAAKRRPRPKSKK